MSNRAGELVSRALWFVGNGGHWQTIATLLELALGEIAELEQRETLPTPAMLVELLEPGSGSRLVGISSTRSLSRVKRGQ